MNWNFSSCHSIYGLSSAIGSNGGSKPLFSLPLLWTKYPNPFKQPFLVGRTFAVLAPDTLLPSLVTPKIHCLELSLALSVWSLPCRARPALCPTETCPRMERKVTWLPRKLRICLRLVKGFWSLSSVLIVTVVGSDTPSHQPFPTLVLNHHPSPSRDCSRVSPLNTHGCQAHTWLTFPSEKTAFGTKNPSH